MRKCFIRKFIVVIIAMMLVINIKIPVIAEEADSKVPYLQFIERCDQSVYDGPGYDYVFVTTVKEQGTYTIVEEVEDSEGNLWGKLKSGIGWVDLTEIQAESSEKILLSANYADENLILDGDYHYYSSDGEYAVTIAFRAYGKLHDVAIFSIELGAEGLLPGEDLYILEEMTEKMPLVAKLNFPGDMSMYGIRFTDEENNEYVYKVYISGRNGALILNKEFEK